MALALLSGCDLTTLSEQKQHVPDPFDTAQNTDLSPRFPQPMAQQTGGAAPAQGSSYYGQDAQRSRAAEPSETPGVQMAPTGEGYELNFENASVSTVAKVILGDILKVGYIIDPRVQGTVTIGSGRPVPRNELIPVLESALRMSNVVLVPDSGGGYRLIPGGDAQGAGGVLGDGSRQPGYGISVVPLRYTSVQTILKLLDSFAIKPGMARADTAHNLILVQGDGPERKAAVETILTFDVDWMRGQSVGIYPLENATPEELIKELHKFMEDGEGGLNQTLVTLQPVPRLNAVLVVTHKPILLRQAAVWIKRLDRANNAGTSVHVYRLRYGDARQIARVLGDLFGNRQQGLNSPVNQIAPGAGVSSSSSGAAGTETPGGNNQTPGGTTAGVGSPGGNANAGIQLGNMGSGFGNAQGVGGTPGGSTGSSSISAGAFGGTSPQGETLVVLPGIRIAADVANNSLVIYANQANNHLVAQLLEQLDRPQLQVAIHATIAEVTLNNDLQFGVEYYLQGNSGSAGFTTSLATQALSAVLPGGNLLLGPLSNPRIVINALRTITDVKVLSSPSVVVLDNQLATLLVGDQVPVETASANVLAATTSTSSTVVNSINYINTGVILRVLPRVNANGHVILDVEQEVSGVVGTGSAAQSLTPTVSQRQIKSAISVASGQTVLLGGLITETQQRTRSGIPILEQLPGGVGNLFSSNDRSTQRTEIIIFIQPEIIRNSVDASKVAEELRAKLRGSADATFQKGPSLFGDPRFAQ